MFLIKNIYGKLMRTARFSCDEKIYPWQVFLISNQFVGNSHLSNMNVTRVGSYWHEPTLPA